MGPGIRLCILVLGCGREDDHCGLDDLLLEVWAFVPNVAVKSLEARDEAQGGPSYVVVVASLKRCVGIAPFVRSSSCSFRQGLNSLHRHLLPSSISEH